ncbi:MAG: SufD family Fe-S cluster assembly protein, partial [Actinomycetota bacterium]|nr:SufD family Fe-S cluster assembly protein [Actinomycetota bacterium]
MTTLSLLDADVLASSSVTAGEPTWLVERRRIAARRFADQAWPDSRVDEFWRSTPFDVRFDVEREIAAASASPSAPAGVLSDVEGGGVQVTIIDGVLTSIEPHAAATAAGVVVTDLRTAAVEHAALVEAHLGRLTTSAEVGTGSDEDRTVTLSDAAWTGGVFIHVPAEVELDVPISVHVHVSSPGAHLPRVLAVLGHHARATIYLEHTSDEGVTALVDEVVEIVVEDSAKLRLATLQDWNAGIEHLGLQKTELHRDADVLALAFTTGGTTVRLRPEFDLVGPGAKVRPLGIYMASDGQWFDLQPYVRHIAPRATSDVLFKGALQGRSRTVFRGNVFVHRDAFGTSTDENNRSLILTEGARADATPFLEIECSDITAGHGSATGQI